MPNKNLIFDNHRSAPSGDLIGLRVPLSAFWPLVANAHVESMLRYIWRILLRKNRSVAVDPIQRSGPLRYQGIQHTSVPAAVRDPVTSQGLVCIVPPHTMGAANSFGVVPGTLTLTQLRRFHVPLRRRK